MYISEARKQTMNCRKICTLVTLGAALYGLSGCSYLHSQFPNLNLPEPNMSTTAMGAATGTVVGAGVGTLIGSTSGSAGEGFLLGSLAGAAVGAGVGHHLDDRTQVRL